MKKLVIPSVIAVVASVSLFKSKQLSVPEPTPENTIIVPENSYNLRHQLRNLVQGGSVTLKTSDDSITGVVDLKQEIVGRTIQYSGTLTNRRGTFAIAHAQDDTVSGVILLPTKNKAYVLNNVHIDDRANFELADINTLVCHYTDGNNHNMDFEEAAAPGDAVSTSTLNTTVKVPSFASKPTAKFHIFLDFDGETVRDPLWNGGKEIVAIPQKLTTLQIQEICELVAERFSAFSINVTTDYSYYANAPINSRTRAIFTPTNNWKPGFGGIAMIGSVKNAGKGVYSPTVPCWVFTNMLSRVRSVGECAAHELGHTLGLLHDGQNRDAYYYGHGNWAPIMGSAYNRLVAQWSKGEYVGANNKQDDFGVILANTNVTTAVNRATVVTPITINGINDTGVICNARDVAKYNVVFRTACKMKFEVQLARQSALNVKLDIYDASNRLVTSSNPTNALATSVTVDVVPGMYTVTVAGAAEGDLITGYSAYGSVGTFKLLATLAR